MRELLSKDRFREWCAQKRLETEPKETQEEQDKRQEMKQKLKKSINDKAFKEWKTKKALEKAE